MRLVVFAVVLVVAAVVAAYLVVPGPVSRSFLHASLERESGVEGPGSCRIVRADRWRCRVGRRTYAVRMKAHACWTARTPGRRPLEGCIHLLEPKVL
jgi:hypothetical protein